MTLAGMAPNPEVEVPGKARRRRFTAEYEREILRRAGGNLGGHRARDDQPQRTPPPSSLISCSRSPRKARTGLNRRPLQASTPQEETRHLD